MNKFFKFSSLVMVLLLMASCSSDNDETKEESPDDVLVTSITILGSDITDGKPINLSADLAPSDATNTNVDWSVSDKKIAEVSLSGVLTPRDNGEVTVIATAKDGSEITGELVIKISGVIHATVLKAENMLLWQRSNGGWPKEPHNDFSGYNREQTATEKAQALSEKNNTDTNIDNDHTIGEIRALLEAFKQTFNPAYLNAAENGLKYLFEAQYDNGGWPQYYPDRSGYRYQITYNDDAMANVMELMWDISKGENDTENFDEGYKSQALEAFNKGIDVMLKTQISVNGVKTAWCAQHHDVTLQPAQARSYELPSISGSESVGVVRTLMLVESPSSEIKQAVQDAMQWFEDAKLYDIDTKKITTDGQADVEVVPSPGNIIWARFYDLQTNEPFFCGRDGIKKKTLAEIEQERRAGYAWYGNWPSKIESEYSNWKSKHGI
ncbi:pectate lyase [Tamlana sp. s12]|uniref:pectate lyase n=1 Tax=Tamlana sp. s12 TaxID=1630406 RepID=UPI0009ED1F66|nr:pectate lyase [Tamlana sp. s12]QQY82335.1 pectate lyase [Tamlana sp. s12]